MLLLVIVPVALGLLAGVYVAPRFIRFVYPGGSGVVLAPADYGLDPEPFEVTAKDGVRIRGWVFEPAGPAAGIVLLCHGRYLDKSRHLEQARFLVRDGFAVVAFDFRGCGDSERPGRRLFNSLWEPLWDVDAVVAFVDDRFADQPHLRRRICLLGYSFGGNMALAHIAYSGREYAALILDSTPLVRWETMLDDLLRRERRGSRLAPVRAIGDRLAVWLAVTWTRSEALYRLAQRSAAALVHTPVLLVVGAKDTFFDIDAASAFVGEHCAGDAEVWRVRRGRHLTNHLVDPDAYAARLTGFLHQALSRLPTGASTAATEETRR